MSLERFAPAQAALSAGRLDESVALMGAQLSENPDAPVGVYRNFATVLVRHQLYEKAEVYSGLGLARYPKDIDLLNLNGVSLRRLGRFPEALKAFDQAAKLAPKNDAIQQNRGNVLNDMRDPGAIAVFTRLVRSKPANSELSRSLGRAHWFSGDLPKAEMRLNLATKLAPTSTDAWLDLSSVINEQGRNAESVATLERAMAASPTDLRLVEAHAVALRRSGRLRDAEQNLIGLLEKLPETAWVHFQLAGVISDYDRPRANIHYEEAIRLKPSDPVYRVAFAESLARTRVGDEAALVERGYQTLMEVLPEMPSDAGSLKVAYEIAGRLADYDTVDKLDDFSTRGRKWVEAGRHTALLIHLAAVRTPEDRHELVEQHRIWGRRAEAGAARWPITHRGPRKPNGKIRVGIMSSDLRAHPVSYFSLPIFEHYDRDRFEVYCYSYYQGDEDRLQKKITDWVDAFRWVKDITERDAAQMIADDQLDILIELGGSTHMNKLSVMAFKPAPLSASWLGYPHSAGLETIDHFILDPYLNPPDPSLLIEEPLLMPKVWLAMSEIAFPERPINPVIPEERNGFLTFGTANNPYKYSREMLRTWARVVAAVPGSRFLFVRPEGNAPSFRKNILANFAAEGVSEDRVRFESVRGAHMPFYNEIDMGLDTFPQTGGTTTCESLSMGVPVVTLVGSTVFERMSYSVLSNAGLGDLCAHTEDEYIATALKLAGDASRRKMLRTELRGMLKASPLGQTQQFAVDFYEMITRAVEAAKAKGKIPQAAA